MTLIVNGITGDKIQKKRTIVASLYVPDDNDNNNINQNLLIPQVSSSQSGHLDYFGLTLTLTLTQLIE